MSGADDRRDRGQRRGGRHAVDERAGSAGRQRCAGVAAHLRRDLVRAADAVARGLGRTGRDRDHVVHAVAIAARSTLPSTATPSVPPARGPRRSWPIRCRPGLGSEPMIASVAGDIASHMPRPIMLAPAPRVRSRCRRRTWRAREGGGDRREAAATTTFVPAAAWPRPTAWSRDQADRHGQQPNPRLERVVAHDRLQVGGQEVHDAHQGEEHEREREAAALKRGCGTRHVEHRVIGPALPGHEHGP